MTRARIAIRIAPSPKRRPARAARPPRSPPSFGPPGAGVGAAALHAASARRSDAAGSPAHRSRARPGDRRQRARRRGRRPRPREAARPRPRACPAARRDRRVRRPPACEARPGNRRKGRASRASLDARSDHGLWSPSTARRNPLRTVSASSFARIAAARAGSKRNAARIASGVRHGRASSSGGRTRPSRSWRRPAILENQAREGAADRRTQPGQGRFGGGPAAGATSRKATTPASSTTHRIASHQPSGASDGRAMPALNVLSAMWTACSRRNDGPGGGNRSGTPAA